jgi:alginate O-acetyltransferase complex protein AlgJ
MPQWPFPRRGPAAPPALDHGDALTPAHVAAVYEQLLGRTPTPDEVDHQLANARTLSALLEPVLSSEERRLRAPAEAPPRRHPRVVNVYTEELARWSHAPGTWSDDGVAVVGRDGWLFLGAGSNAILEQYRGAVPLPDDWHERWVEAMEVRRREAAELGVRLCGLIVPDKLPVLRDRFAGELPDPREVAPPAARLADDPRTGLLWPVELLRDVPGGAYLRTDTHLTYAGNAALAGLLGRELGVSVPVDLPEERIRRYLTSGDLGSRYDPEVVEVVTAAADFGAAEVVESNYEELVALGGHIGTRQVLHNECAGDPRTAVVFGDSYALAARHYQGIAWFMGQAFRCVHFVWIPFGWDPGYVERAGADVVVCEGAERFALRPPDLRVDAMDLAEQTVARLRAAARGEAPQPK